MAAVLRGAVAPFARDVGVASAHRCRLLCPRHPSGTFALRPRCIPRVSLSESPANICTQLRRSFASGASSSERDPYKVLGVDRNDSPEKIKKAYRKEALKWHPDKNPDSRKEAEKRFAEVANAYETLSKPEKKHQFDMGDSEPSNRYGGAPGGSPGGFQGQGFHSQADAERLFKEVFGAHSINDVFGQLFGGAKTGPKTLKVGMHIQVQSEAGTVLKACRRSSIDSANDSARIRSLGKRGRVIKVDQEDQTVKITVEGVGDVWFGASAVRPIGGSGRAGSGSSFGFGGLGGFGGAQMSDAGTVQMKQEVVTLPDGSRVVRVTRVERAPDGTLRQQVSETPMQ